MIYLLLIKKTISFLVLINPNDIKNEKLERNVFSACNMLAKNQINRNKMDNRTKTDIKQYQWTYRMGISEKQRIGAHLSFSNAYLYEKHRFKLRICK